MEDDNRNNMNAGRENPYVHSYITRSECAAISTSIKKDLDIVKLALVGPDLQGGMVKQVNDLHDKVEKINGLVSNHKSEDSASKERWSREKIALIGATGTILGIILGRLLELI